MKEEHFEVYAVAGYALYVCQALEETMIHALVNLVFLPQERSRLQREASAEAQQKAAEKAARRASKMRLAELMAMLAAQGLPEAWAGWLKRARNHRNFIAHGLFRRFWRDMETARGCDGVIGLLGVFIHELEQIILAIQEIEEELLKERRRK